MRFIEVLKDLMLEHDINIKELAKRTGIKLGSLYFYFKNDTILDAQCAIKLSECFKCSINYLLGLTEVDNITLKITNKSFIENYLFLLNHYKTNNYNVCNKININRSSIYNWKKGKTPKMVNLIEFAKFFNISVDFLLGRTEEY